MLFKLSFFENKEFHVEECSVHVQLSMNILTSDRCCFVELVAKIVNSLIWLGLRFGDFTFIKAWKTLKALINLYSQTTFHPTEFYS